LFLGENLSKIENYPNGFRPKWSFVKSIPGQVARVRILEVEVRVDDGAGAVVGDGERGVEKMLNMK
jgi:hypothetical protein